MPVVLGSTMCLLALALIAIAHHVVGTTLGHHSASSFGWLISFVGVIVCATGLRLRAAAAFLLAPAFGVLVTDVVWQSFDWRYPSPSSSRVGFLIILFPLTYGFAAAIGVPTLIVLERLSWLRFWHYVAAGVAVGLTAGLLLAIALAVRAGRVFAAGGLPFQYPWDLSLLLALLAAVPAYAVYWIIAPRPHA